MPLVKSLSLITLIALGALSTSVPARADDSARRDVAEIKFEIGTDVVHAPGLRVWSLSLENENSRFRYGSFGQDGIEVEFFGAEYVWHHGKWSPSFGLVHIERLTPLSGTHWNFSVGLQYQVTKKVFIGALHFSHAKGLGIEPNRTNNGFNVVTVGTRF